MDDLNKKIDLINEHLKKYVSDSGNYQKVIFDSIKYSLFAGGKRMRPVLLIAAYEASGGTDIEAIMPFASAIEMIHTYSLIHDDLPAMDNDEYRRGKLTNHKMYGEGIAILAGDGLLNMAFETMIQGAIDLDSKFGLKAMKVIANASGVYGMVGGQVVDLDSEHKKIDKDRLNYIHENKTASMIRASLKAGAILAGVDNLIELFHNAGTKLGIAFQIQDDILDVTGKENELGKNTRSDSRNEKATFVSLYGLEKSIEYQKQYSDEAIELFKSLGNGGKFLVELTEYLAMRKK